jgi:small GTP-binding protein
MTEPLSIDVSFRVVVAGSSDVGKSCLIRRIARNTFSNISSATIGMDHVSKKTVTDKNVTICTSYTDLAGQERFRSVCRSAYRDATVVLVVIDASLAAPHNAYEDAAYWVGQASEYAPINVPIILVANKVDKLQESALSEDAIETHGVTSDVIKRIYTSRIFFTSAHTGEGADELEGEVRRIEEATSSYQLAATASARSSAFDSYGGAMTAESNHTIVGANEPLLCIVPNADGSLEVLRERGLVNLNPRRVVGREAHAPPASASSLSPSSRSPLRTDSHGCAC